MDWSYEEKLKRAIEQTPDFERSEGRFDIPTVSVRQEGNKTVLENASTVADELNRDVERVITYLQNELGTGVELDGGRALFVGSFRSDRVQQHINDYAENDVLCSQCELPDTRIETHQGEEIIRCTACGAQTPT